jgi:hypothetical protein
VFTYTDLPGIDEALARRVIAVARSIAPCLDSLEGEAKQDAIAILGSLASEARVRGPRGVKAQRTASSSVDYSSVDTWFSEDDRGALRALCAAATAAATTGGPIGQFPKPGIVAKMWPEDCA